MKELRKLVARVDKDHWILLSQNLSSDEWTFLIWGTYPLSGNFGAVSEPEAKERAQSAAQEHLQQHGLRRGLADSPELTWRLAVRYIAA
jgi:hypothetical protein